MRKTLKENLAFFIPYFLFLLIAGVFLFIHSKGDAHLILNQYRFEFCDRFFCYATFLGDFIAVIVIVLFLCFFRYRFALLLALSNIIAAMATQLLKHTLFADVVRPKKYFEGLHDLNLVAGYENYLYNSFPSGHSTSAFATFFCLALIIESKFLKFLMFVIALTVGFSRIYLSQHFLNDVYAGSLIGVVFSFLAYQYLFLSKKNLHATWMDKSFLLRK